MVENPELYVIGGHVRQNLFRKLEEWQSCDKALIVRLDPKTEKSSSCAEYVSPQESCSNDNPAILFKSAFLQGHTLYACTSTEVLVYKLPGFEQIHRISLPFFNDLHHVCPTQRGTLAVAVTGLDLVVEITMAGEVVREWNVLGEDTWSRFDRSTDYRKVLTTKPHKSHPNHVFELQGELWVTRFEQKDAVCLTNSGLRIEIGVGKPHDGYLFEGSIYFTTVEGRIVIVDQETLAITHVHDLNKMRPEPRKTLGWCRGLLPLDERYIWVGFTRVRPTRFKENVVWIKNGTAPHKPSHLGLYDLQKQSCIREIALEPHGIGVVFSLFRAT